jgi:integrase
MRRADLAGVTWAEVSDHAVVRIAEKKSRGKRRRAVIPLTVEAKEVLARLRAREQAEGIDDLLVNSFGRPWKPGSLTQVFNATRDAANDGKGICQPPERVGEDPRSKHLHDCRSTFVTHLCRGGLTDEEIGNIVAWSPQNVARVRRIYVDDARVVVALAERIANASAKRPAK